MYKLIIRKNNIGIINRSVYYRNSKKINKKRIHSSAVEHSLDKRMVSGSNPLGFISQRMVSGSTPPEFIALFGEIYTRDFGTILAC